MPAQRGDVNEHHHTCDVAIVGGGIIGLAVAWRARSRGLSVVVLERDAAPDGSAAAHVAAGMIAPVVEAESGDRALLALHEESARRWPAFAAELQDVSGVDPGFRRTGTLVVARDASQAAWLEHELGLRERLGLQATRLLPAQARSLEPALAPGLRAAMDVPGDDAVDPRAVVAGLLVAARAAGAQVRTGVSVERLLTRDGRAAGVALAGGEEVHAPAVVLAAGAWSGGLEGVPPQARVPVRPLKGQLVRLSDPAGPGLLHRPIRYEGGYLVPRGDGRLIVGATMEERGFDTTVTAGGAYELVRDAAEIVPGVLELVVEEMLAGLRPATPDNAPALGGHPACPGLVYATGHHRNGVLLAPLTADLIAAELAGEDAPHAFGPERFAEPVGSPA